MNPQWVLVGIAALGLAGSGVWTAVNLRIEARLLGRIDELKDWCDVRFVRRPDAPVLGPGLAISRRNRTES